MIVIMVHDTLSNGHAPTYQISLTYLERQKSYGPYRIHQLFDLWVKGQGQMNVTMVRDTPSYDLTSTYQISLTYHERKKRYGPDKRYSLFYLYLTLGSKVQVK